MWLEQTMGKADHYPDLYSVSVIWDFAQIFGDVLIWAVESSLPNIYYILVGAYEKTQKRL